MANSDLVLSIWSLSYFTSKWCRAEAHEAVIKNIPMVPRCLTGTNRRRR